MLPNQFVFYYTDHPEIFNYAAKTGAGYRIDWDAEFVRLYAPSWVNAPTQSVERFVMDGDWLIVGNHAKASAEGREALRKAFVQLQLGFGALEEGFQSLRAAFEAAKRQVQQEG